MLPVIGLMIGSYVVARCAKMCENSSNLVKIYRFSGDN
ncbi:MAG: hypothetical protein N5P05_004419 (plasmid) [Chroococcopsis gigantea SAG 12.99]|nr:hypothetical protein [Chroococcopsis gigantea SAG 12.99]